MPLNFGGSSNASRPGSSDGKPKYDVDLVTLLTRPQREDLVQLLTAATEVMRASLLHSFDPPPPKVEKEEPPQETKSADPPSTSLGTNELGGDSAATSDTPNVLRKPAPELASSVIKLSHLKSTATSSFDQWQQSLLARVFDVMNPPDVDKRGGSAAHMQDVVESTIPPTGEAAKKGDEKPTDGTSPDDAGVENSFYPPIPTGLATSLPVTAKPLVVQSLLLLFLSLETYDARSRTLLRIISSSLQLPPVTLVHIEEAVAINLVHAAQNMSAEEERKKKEQDGAWGRRLKVGLAGVAGAAVIGITGGLAAPLVAAGIGTVMSGIGLGATAAAGYLGALAGSGALVGALFGAYGGKMSGEMMQRYAAEIEDFAFIPVKPISPDDQAHHQQDKSHHEKHKEHQTETHPETNRLSVTIGISGWITNESDFYTPWRTLSSHSSVYALRFETTALLDLGSALTTMIKSYAWSYLKTEIIKRTVLATLYTALWPIGLMKVARVVDNPFSIAKTRAYKAGEVMADALINRAQGGRPVTLVAYSLGARVVYSCLLTLAERGQFGIIENVYIMGSPVPSTMEEWVAMRSVVSGRLVNVWSENDYILAFLYRTSAVQLGVAGLQSVDWPEGVENLNVSEDVEGHLRYKFLVGDIVGRIGGEELVEWDEVMEQRRLADEFKRVEERMEKEAKEREGKDDDDLEEVAQKVEEKREERHEEKQVVQDVAQMKLAS